MRKNWIAGGAEQRRSAASARGRMVDDHVALYTRLLEADPEDRAARSWTTLWPQAPSAVAACVVSQCCAGTVSPGASGRRKETDTTGGYAEVDESQRSTDTGGTSSAGSRLPAGVALICGSRGPTLQLVSSVTSPGISGMSGSVLGAPPQQQSRTSPRSYPHFALNSCTPR